MLRLITFDLDNTLWPVDAVIRRAERTCSDWIAQHHPDAAAALSADRVRAVRDRLVRERPAYLNNLTELRRDAMASAFMAAGFAPREARHIAADAFLVFHEARNQVVFFPDTRATLEALADHYILGALSNGNADLERIGIRDLFAFHHSAESVGQRKPAPDMFRAALHSAKVTAAESVHVGDHPREDIGAALDQGFHAVWANLIDLRWPQDLDPPELVIHHLQELPDRLQRLDARS